MEKEMIYPSLVFISKPEAVKQSVNPEFFENVNLTKLLSKKALDVMSQQTEKADIEARRQVFRDLESEAYAEKVSSVFSLIGDMLKVQSLAASMKEQLEKNICFLGLAEKYAQLIEFCESAEVSNLLHNALSKTIDISLGEGGREGFLALLDNAKEKFSELGCAEIEPSSRVSRYTGEVAMNDILSRFGEEITIDTVSKNITHRRADMDLILSLGRKCLHEAGEIVSFAEKYKALGEVPLTEMYNEMGFYISVKALTDRLKKSSIPYCYPEISDTPSFKVSKAMDISLISFENQNIVANDIDFSDSERLFFLTGANGGGKTTYIRTCAIALILFINGCPVPCEGGNISPFSQIFTHFSKDERFEGSGRFVEEEKRIDELNPLCDDKTFVLLNETFSGTDEIKGLKKTLWEMNELKERHSFGIYVTHFHEINTAGYPILNAMIDESDSNRRTFKIVRSDGTKSSYAYDILKKYSLTGDDLKARLSLKKERDRK